MTAAVKLSTAIHFPEAASTLEKFPSKLTEALKSLPFSSISGHASRKNRFLSSTIAQLDIPLGGGIVRGRISEFIGVASSGRTTLAAAFAAAATSHGEVVGWIDGANAFDPATIAAAGVDLARTLWASARDGTASRSSRHTSSTPFTRKPSALLKAAELILDAGGFGLVVIDFGTLRYPISQSSALRLARAAERTGAAVIVLASRRMCGTFASLSLAMKRADVAFGRAAGGSPAVLDGLELEVRIARNKFGGSGGSTIIHAVTDPAIQLSLPFADAETGRNVAHHRSGN